MILKQRIINRARKIRYYARRIQFRTFEFLGLEAQLLKNTSGKRLLIYHGIDRAGDCRFNTRFISRNNFERQIAYFCEHYKLVTLDDYFRLPPDKDKLTLSITFDDGYLNNYKYALPVLEKYRVPAAFCITGIMATDTPVLWPDILDIYSYHHNADFSINGEGFYKNEKEIYASRDRKINLHHLCKLSGHRFKRKLTRKLLSLTDKKILERFSDHWMQMDAKTIRELALSPVATICSHGYYHNNFAEIELEDSIDEIHRSKLYLEDIIQKEIDGIAFPDGSYTKPLLKACSEMGLVKQLASAYLFKEDYTNPEIEWRFGINPYISFNDQIACIIKGSYY